MHFPQFDRKHLEEALFNPGDFIKYKKWDRGSFPKKIVITYQRSPLRYFKRKYSGKYQTLDFTGGHKIYNYNGVGFIKMLGIGSPHAVTIFEELISMGAREFVNMGTAGGLDKEGIYLCDRAIRDEGTSHHYIENGKYSYPNEGLTKRLQITLNKNHIKFQKATTWTIDAPYRETKVEIEKYKSEGVATVEMEASALFTVAKLRGAKIASVFVVSDVLGKKWEPKFHTLDVKKALNQLVDCSIQCLLKS